MKPDVERVSKLLTDTVILLCKNGLSCNQDIRIQGLLGITIDTNEVFLVSINECCRAAETPSSSAVSSSGRDSESLDKERSRKRPREDAADIVQLQDVPKVHGTAKVPHQCAPSHNSDARPRSAGAPSSSRMINPQTGVPQLSANCLTSVGPRFTPRSSYGLLSSVQGSAVSVSADKSSRHMSSGHPPMCDTNCVEQQAAFAIRSDVRRMASDPRINPMQYIEHQQQTAVAHSMQRLSNCNEGLLLPQQQQQQKQFQQHISSQQVEQHYRRSQQRQQKQLDHALLQNAQLALQQSQRPPSDYFLGEHINHHNNSQQPMSQSHSIHHQGQVRIHQSQQHLSGAVACSNQVMPPRLTSASQCPISGIGLPVQPMMDPVQIRMMEQVTIQQSPLLSHHGPRGPALPSEFDHQRPSGSMNSYQQHQYQQMVAASSQRYIPQNEPTFRQIRPPGDVCPAMLQYPRSGMSPANRSNMAVVPHNQGGPNRQPMLPINPAPSAQASDVLRTMANFNHSSSPTTAVQQPTIVKSSASPGRSPRVRPRVEHIDLCLDDSSDESPSVPVSNIRLIQPDNLDGSISNVECDAGEQPASISSSIDNSGFEMDLFEMPSMANVREICPDNDDENVVDNGCTSTFMPPGGTNSVQNQSQATVSNSSEATASSMLNTSEQSSGSLQNSGLSSELVAENTDLVGLSVDESQAIVDLLFDTV